MIFSLRSFVDPDDLVAYPYPSYILYETLADIQGGRHQRIQLNPDWSWNWDTAASETVIEPPHRAAQKRGR